MATPQAVLELDGLEVVVTNPDKVFFPEAGHTKMDLVRYYVAVAEGALRGAGGRPMALKRFVNGAAGDFFFQKRAPENRPDWLETVELSFPSGRTADEVVPAQRGRPGLGDEPWQRRSQSPPGARRGSRPSR
jgi:DNA primase